MLAELNAIRSAGVCISHGELDRGLVGIAVPLASPAHRLTAALGFVISRRRFATSDAKRLTALLTEAGARMLAALPTPNEAPTGPSSIKSRRAVRAGRR